MNDIMSSLRAKVGVKLEGGKPPLPKGDSLAKAGKKRKVDDTVITVEEDLKMENLKANMESAWEKVMKFMGSLVKEVEVKEDQIKVLTQKAKVEGERTVQANARAEQAEKDLMSLTTRMLKVEEEHIKELEEAKEKFMADATKAVMESRINMIKEFEAGKHIAWKIEDEVAMLDAFLCEEVDVGEVNSNDVKVTEQGGAGKEEEKDEAGTSAKVDDGKEVGVPAA